MSHFRHKIDTVEVTEPLGWKSLSTRYERNPTLMGNLVEYSSKLTFYGDAYTALKTIYDAGACGTAVYEADARPGTQAAWTNVITGVIIVKDIEWNHQKCTAVAGIEENDCITQFLDNSSLEVDLNAPNTISGTSTLTTPIEQINSMFEDITGTLWSALAYPNTYGTSVFNAFDHILNYITDGCLRFTSDYFTTVYQPNIIEFEFTVNPANGDFLQAQIQDIAGNTYTINSEVDTGRNYYRDFARCFISSDQNLQPLNLWLEPHDYNIDTTGNTKVQIYSWFPMTINSASAGTGTVVTSTLQAYTEGMEGMYITNGQLLINNGKTNNQGAHFISFDQLWNYLTRKGKLDLSMSFEEVAGQWYMRVEPKSYYVDSPPAVTIRKIKDLTERTNIPVIAQGYNLSQEQERLDTYTYSNGFADFFGESEETQRGLILRPVDYDCGNVDWTTPADMYQMRGEKMNLIGSGGDEADDDWFTIFTREIVGVRTAYDHIWTYWDSVTHLAEEQFHAHNELFIPDKAWYLRRFSLPASNIYFEISGANEKQTDYQMDFTIGPATHTVTRVLSANDVETTEGDGFAPKIYSFEAYLKLTDWALLTGQSQVTINPTDDAANDQDVWILNAEYNYTTTRLKFEGLGK